MKKNIQKILLVILVLFSVSVGGYFTHGAEIKEWFVDAYLNQGKACVYNSNRWGGSTEALPKNSCVFEYAGDDYKLSPELDSLITKVVDEDFPGYSRVDSWISVRDPLIPTIQTEMVQRNPLVKAVWPCTYPEFQNLTTSTMILALCSVTPEGKPLRYSSSVTIYELRAIQSGFFRRRLFQEGPISATPQFSDTFHSVIYPLVRDKFSIVIRTYELTKEGKTKVDSKWLLQWGKSFMHAYNYYGDYDWSMPAPDVSSVGTPASEEKPLVLE